MGVVVVAGLAACSHEPSTHQVRPQSAVMLVYLRPRQLYFPKALGNLESTYKSQVAELPANDAIASAFRSVADNTSWISRMDIGKFDSGQQGGIDIKQLAEYVHDGDLDAIVVVMPLAEFTSGLEGLMVSATIVVEKDSPSGPVEVKHRDFVETISLENAGAPLSGEQIASLRALDSPQAQQSRADIWFSHHASRIKTGLLLDLTVLNRHARAFLESPLAD